MNGDGLSLRGERQASSGAVPALLGAAVLLSACGDGEATAGAGEWRAERDTIGDTVVVHTVSGSVWDGERRLAEEVRIGRLEGPEEETFGQVRGLAAGPEGSVYVVDGQAPALRQYASDGTYVRTFGAEGGGPGEYAGLDGGVAVLPDGRVLLRDPGNGRINVYSPGGESVGEWRIGGGMFTSTPLYADTAGRVYHVTFDFREEGPRESLILYGSDGSALDTLPVPDRGREGPFLEATFESEGGGRRTGRRNVPFSPTERWTVSPLGYLVTGFGGRYAVDLLRPDTTALRIGREREPVAVKPGEEENEREQTVAAMREIDPGWDWSGPGIPDTKPYFRNLFADRDGRIWVQLAAEGGPIPEEAIEEPEDPNAPPPERWREPVLYDVFEPDGRYMGTVRAPDGFRTWPRPVVDGDRVWALVEDDLGVQYVVRYRIARPGAGGGTGPN